MGNLDKLMIPKYEDFKNNGILVGSGSFKNVYKLGNYVMAEAIDKNDKWCKQQLYKQIEIWEEFKSDESKAELLCPLLKYSYEDLYYIAPFCEPVIEKDMLTFSELYVLTSDELLHYPYIEDLVLQQNQGKLNDRTVIIDYGTSTEDFFQWQLEKNNINIDLNNLKETNLRYVDVGSIFRVAEVEFDKSFNVNAIRLDSNWETTTLRNDIINLFKKLNYNGGNIIMKSIQEKYYKCLGIVGKYKSLDEVNELPERTRVLYDICGLSLFTQLVSWKLDEVYKYSKEGSSLMKSSNAVLHLIDDNEFELSEYLMCWNETCDACMKIVLSKKMYFDKIYSVMRDDNNFIELSNSIYNKDKGLKELDLF